MVTGTQKKKKSRYITTMLHWHHPVQLTAASHSRCYCADTDTSTNQNSRYITTMLHWHHPGQRTAATNSRCYCAHIDTSTNQSSRYSRCLQSSPLHAEARLPHWPIGTTLADKLWGSKEDLMTSSTKPDSGSRAWSLERRRRRRTVDTSPKCLTGTT